MNMKITVPLLLSLAATFSPAHAKIIGPVCQGCTVYYYGVDVDNKEEFNLYYSSATRSYTYGSKKENDRDYNTRSVEKLDKYFAAGGSGHEQGFIVTLITGERVEMVSGYTDRSGAIKPQGGWVSFNQTGRKDGSLSYIKKDGMIDNFEMIFTGDPIGAANDSYFDDIYP